MNATSLIDQKLKKLAEKSGWTIMKVRGYLDGQTTRNRDQAPSSYAMVGSDDYCEGYRDGYYLRPMPEPASNKLNGASQEQQNG